MAGFCPGPALVALGMGETKASIFVVAMFAGMGIFELWSGASQPARPPRPGMRTRFFDSSAPSGSPAV